jgi:hypothetical protein
MKIFNIYLHPKIVLWAKPLLPSGSTASWTEQQPLNPSLSGYSTGRVKGPMTPIQGYYTPLNTNVLKLWNNLQHSVKDRTINKPIHLHIGCTSILWIEKSSLSAIEIVCELKIQKTILKEELPYYTGY